MDVAASEFYNDGDKTYDLNFKEEVISSFASERSLLIEIGICDEMATWTLSC